MRHVLALIQVDRILRWRAGSDIRETRILTEFPQQIPVLIRRITGGLGISVFVLNIHSRFPAESAEFSESPINEESNNQPSPLALGDHAFYLVQTTVRTGRATFDDITANFPGATATARFRRSPLDGTGINREAGGGSLPFLRIGL